MSLRREFCSGTEATERGRVRKGECFYVIKNSERRYPLLGWASALPG